MSFNLKKGTPILKIKGGKHDGKKIRLNDSEKSHAGDFVEFETSGILQQIPSGKFRDSLYICGPAGAGKSTYGAAFAKEYKKKYPHNPIILFCPKAKDAVLDRLNPLRIKLTDDNILGDDKIDLEEIKDSLCIFDDTEGIPDNAIKKGVMQLRDNILTVGRSLHISCITISHLVTDNRNTKIPIVESEFFTFFPNGGLNYQVLRFLKAYVGLSKPQIDKLMGLRSRWVTLHKSYPLYAFSKDQAYILK